jgi:hypothetical protein
VRHIIKKQIIQIELNSQQEAFRVQHLVSEHYWKEIVPILQKVFDSITSENEIIRLEHLEIDLGVISIKDIEQGKWVDKLETILKKQLDKILHEAHADEAVHRESGSRSVFRQWLFYMEHGYLPWNVWHANESWYAQTLRAFATDFNAVSALRKHIINNPVFTERVILQHPESFLISLAETLTAEKQVDLPEAFNEIYEIFYFMNQLANYIKKDQLISTDNKKSFIIKLWKAILWMASKNESHENTQALVEKILTAHITEPAIIKKIKKELPRQKISLSLPVLDKLQQKLTEAKKEERKKEKELKGRTHEETRNKVKDEPERTLQQNEEIKKEIKQKRGTQKEDPSDRDVEKKSTQQIAENKPTVTNPISEEKTQAKEKSIVDEKRDKQSHTNIDPAEQIKNALTGYGNKEKNILHDTIDEEGIFVQHAGAVLLHPFLPAFFKRLGLTTQEGFIDNDAHQKALHLLYFLSTGDIQPKEYELVIGKILCSYPLQQPVDMELNIAEAEFNEANDLIEAVITQWDILKNSSPTALRESFLQRNGKLFTRNKRLCLQIEKSAIDVLLDHLPWNLSIIKLPWMDEILSVEWR